MLNIGGHREWPKIDVGLSTISLLRTMLDPLDSRPKGILEVKNRHGVCRIPPPLTL